MAIIQNLEAFVQSYPAGLDSVTDLQLSQNENGRQIRFTIGGVTIPAGSVATISGTKPDGVVYSNTGTIEGSDTVIFDEDVQMTAVFGTWYAKIRITNAGNTIASARVRFIIDKDPVDAGAIPSESQLNGLVAEAEEYAGAAEDAAERAAITYGSPLTASTAAAMTDVNRVYVYTGSESGYTYGNWYYYNGSAWVSGGVYNSAAVETDTTLTESGVPADAKATGDKIAELKDDLSHISGLSDDIKDALLACFEKVAWIDEHGQNYYDALEEALYPQPVPEWDYEWYATSQTIPTDMTGVSEYDFTTEPGAIYILRSNAILDFDFIGDCEVEIEAKFNDYLGGSNAPQITVCMANDQTSGHYFGGVICANKATNSPYIYYNIDGTWNATSFDQRQYHVYNIKAENGTLSVTIDGTLVATGSGREYTTSLFTRYWQPNYEPAFLKSIKFKRL